MERLYAEALLWAFGFCDETRYNALLDELFMADSANDLYLQLEECCGDAADTLGRLSRCLEQPDTPFADDVFGRQLFAALRSVYVSCAATYDDLEDFGLRCHRLWCALPPDMADNEPFLTLVYADDPLNWGDEGEVRRLYEAAFAFYEEK